MIETLLQIAGRAAEIILKRYQTADFEVQIKEDKSPLTSADIESHEYITEQLSSNFDFPVLSEEAPIGYQQRKNWSKFWLVDPLDGTKDFIARTDDFTVNIALIEETVPVCGIIAVPARGVIYYAEKNKGAYKVENGAVEKIYNNRSTQDLICAESRFHTAAETEEFCSKHNVSELRRFGSAVKLCKIAEGEIDVYPRFVPTKEWDTAAGHCILNEGGGKLVDIASGKDLVYNKKEILNGFFIASRKNLTFI